VTLAHHVHARNDAVSSENKIHDDDVARRYGFGGGLVPGVTVYGYLTWLPVTRWGVDWLERGTMATRLERPVYDGDDVDVRGEVVAGEELAVSASNQHGVVCATGRAALPATAATPLSPAGFLDQSAPDPDDRPPAGPDSLAAGTRLGTVSRRWDAAARARYLDVLGDDLAVYDRLGLAHPGGLIRAANEVLSSNVRLGPWIHVASEASAHGLVHDGDTVTTYGRVAERFDRKGHQFVVLDVLSAVGDRPVLGVRHTAIYSPRAST
jgi:acyl dehydratase